MKLKFEQEGNSHYAIAFEEVYNRQVCDELWFADIDLKDSGFIIRWQDNYSNKIPSNSLIEAKELILREFSKHTPQIVGNRYDL